MATANDVSTALYGAWRLACLDPRGMGFFDRSVAGFWRSYRAAIILYPAFLGLLILQVGGAAPDIDWPRIILVETIGYIIAWTAFPLVMLPVARLLGRDQSWLDFMVAYNWSQILQGALLLATTLLAESGALPDALAGGLALAASVAVLLYGWFIARTALGVSGTAATMIVLLDQALAIFVSRVAQALH